MYVNYIGMNTEQQMIYKIWTQFLKITLLVVGIYHTLLRLLCFRIETLIYLQRR